MRRSAAAIGAAGARGVSGARGAGASGGPLRGGSRPAPRSPLRAVAPRPAVAAASRPTPAPLPRPREEPEDAKEPPPLWHDPRFQGKLDELKVLGDEVIILQRKRTNLDDQIKEKNTIARAIMEDIDADNSWSVGDDDWTCSFIRPRPTEKLVKELLIQAGVTMKQLAKGTKKEPRNPYVSFQAKKAGGR